MDAVIKVGGSLSETPKALKALCLELNHVANKHSIVIVPGGGKFADVIREFDEKYNLPPALSHRLAILAMDQYGLVLSQLIPNSKTCDSLEGALQFSESKKILIFLPSKLMSKDDPFEASWDVTSDSIAAYIAFRLQALKAIFITDVEGIYTSNPKLYADARLLTEISVRELQTFAERTSVDKYLPKFLSKSPLDCYVLNGNFPNRVETVLSGKPTICTKILASFKL